jgi:hypothetical protein
MTQRVVELSFAKERFEVIPGNSGISHGESPYFRFIFAMLDRSVRECKWVTIRAIPVG